MAQEPYSYPLSEVPSDAVYNLHQDRNGYIWLGTNKGLVRYDGSEYKIYRSADQTSVAGSDIQEDREGRIWYENFDGYLYYIQNDSLHSFHQQPPAGFFSYGLTRKLLYVVQKKGVDVYDLKTLRRKSHVNIPFDVAESAVALGEDFYFIADDILYKIDSKLRVTKSTQFVGKGLDFKQLHVYKDQFVFVTSKFNETQKIYCLDAQLRCYNEIPTGKLGLIQGSNCLDNRIWLHTSNGTHAYNLDGTTESQKGIFTDYSISEIIRDHQNTYWFATVNKGIYLVPELNYEVFKIHPTEFVRLCATPKGYLLGTQKGELLQTDNQLGNKKILRDLKENVPVYYLYHNPIENQTFFSDKGFSVVTQGNYEKPRTYNIALKEMVRLDSKYYGIAATSLGGLYKNPEASGKIASKWDDVFEKFTDSEFPEFARVLKGVRAKCVDYDPKQEILWLGTNLGLYRITPKGIQEIRSNGQPVYAERIAMVNGKGFVLDTKGRIRKLTPNGELTDFSAPDLLEDAIRLIRKTENGLIIVGIDHLYLYHAAEDRLERIDFQIKTRQIYDVLKIEGQLVVLTPSHVLRIPLPIRPNHSFVPFHIQEVRINQKPYSWKEVLQLSHQENAIEIDFSVLNFREKMVPVFYRINQEDWILMGTHARSLSFPRLSPGNYTVEFKIGSYIAHEKIHLEIHPPFWKSWWFILLSVLGLSGGMLFYYRRKSRAMEAQIALLNEKVVLEKNLSKSMMSTIRSQMNPHFFYNALNTIQAYIFTNDKYKANAYLAKFSKLTRSILEMSAKETIVLSQELEALQLYLELEKMRFQEGFTYTLTVAPECEETQVEFPPMLIQPYVENAVKHGLLHREGEKRLEVHFRLVEGHLEVVIDDNGIGRKRSEALNRIRSQKHQSFATQANEKRMEILHRDRGGAVGIRIIDKYGPDGNATGTQVILRIPIH